jgi:hypothetical protein
MKKSLLLISVVLISLGTTGQTRKPAGFNNSNKGKAQDRFLDKQFWLGFKAGINLSQADPTKRYSVISPANYSAGLTNKVYDSYNKVGSQASIEVTFYYKGFSFSTQPTYIHSRFTYSNQFTWDNPEIAAEQLILNYDQEQKVDYADFPLTVKYDITRTRLRPYAQFGIFYSILINANKSVAVSGTDYASGGTNEFKNEPVIVGAKDLFANYWGLVGGVGANYNLGNVRLVLDVSYRKGMSNIANTKNRYSNDQLSGVGDVQDDSKLNNIVISAGCLFPMRYLSNSFKALDK